MRVLVLGNDTPLGYSISAFANPLRRHQLIGISIEKTRWGRAVSYTHLTLPTNC